MSYNVSGIAGPALAGVLTVSLDPTRGTVVLGGIAVLGAAVILALPLARRCRPGSAGQVSLTAGVRAIATDPVLRVVTAASSLGQLGPGALAIVAAVLAQSAGRPVAAGWLLSAVAAGGLLGSLWWTWRPAPSRRAPSIVMLALLGVGAPLALAAATTGSLIATAALFAVSGVFLGPFTGALFLTREEHAPPEARAQVFTISAGLKTSTAAAGAALGGVIAALPVPGQLLLVGFCPLLAGAIGMLRVKPAAW